MAQPQFPESFYVVLEFFLEERRKNPEKQFNGREVREATELPSGVLYPLLSRMCKSNWLDFEWKKEKEVPRRYYSLTEGGHREGRRVLIGKPEEDSTGLGEALPAPA